jgi:DNA polymerase III subunit epsilon
MILASSAKAKLVPRWDDEEEDGPFSCKSIPINTLADQSITRPFCLPSPPSTPSTPSASITQSPQFLVCPSPIVKPVYRKPQEQSDSTFKATETFTEAITNLPSPTITKPKTTPTATTTRSAVDNSYRSTPKSENIPDELCKAFSSVSISSNTPDRYSKQVSQIAQRVPTTRSPQLWTPFSLPNGFTHTEIKLLLGPDKLQLVFFDTETTGLTSADRIVEIAAVLRDFETLQERHWHALVNPQGRVSSPYAIKAHKLTDKLLQEQHPFYELIDSLLAFFEDKPLVAHNGPFDRRMIQGEFNRALSEQMVAPDVCQRLVSLRNDVYCTLATARTFRSNNSLDTLCTDYGVDRSLRNFGHGALQDSLMLANVFPFILRDANKLVSIGYLSSSM